ncbi:oligosaccharide flippase family protein [Bordetella avium]|uniref:oligosaccharide flippase family protein n=1 Tax=Bordetella avium TaxID=521 RepID=UPI000E0B453D|nr:polysaccharide biosynthesis C-terminal domain-containing protein [Bordetella avium]AZY47763.1 hypothetical protein C0J09_00445 [Bordetella avium]AZY51132.1 hypothetical protein C0J07_00450 [Bordetella avium]RIQ15011.1 hypothetical protein D0432_02475 [Bordetella avium]RIQ18498.1 hypothetical protein D0850_05365 [Bordetella avium]RIQ35466.1 hypothetical protein D0849_05580 [Bordetella avium]
MLVRIKQLVGRVASGKLSLDIAWNLGSFAILALSGVIINFIIAAVWGPQALGVFNLVFAVYIVLSQVFTLGVHYSVLRHSAHYAQQGRELAQMTGSAVVLGIVAGALAAAVAYAGAPLAQKLFSSARVAEGLQWAAGGLLLFPLNKILLGMANGLRLMRFFAVAQAARYLAILAWVGIVAAAGMDPQRMAAAFAIAELFVLLLCFAYLPGRLPFGRPSAQWYRLHLSFGIRGMPAGMFVELNSRVDVLVLGLFMSETEVGIYSFAAMLVDGYYAILTVIRNNLNPLLVHCLRDNDQTGLQGLIRGTRRLVYPVMLLLGLVLLAGLAILVHGFLPERGLSQSVPVLALLLSGIWLCSAFIPLDNLLMQSGQPGWQTVQHGTLVISNLAFNLLLIPVLGLYGAALGTTLAYVAGTAMLFFLARNRLGIDILRSRFIDRPLS